MTRRAIETLLRETDSDGTSSSSSSSGSAAATGGVGDAGSSSPLALSVEAALLLKAAHVSGAVRASAAAGGSWRDSPLAQLLPPALICLVEVAPRRFAALLSPAGGTGSALLRDATGGDLNDASVDNALSMSALSFDLTLSATPTWAWRSFAGRNALTGLGSIGGGGGGGAANTAGAGGSSSGGGPADPPPASHPSGSFGPTGLSSTSCVGSGGSATSQSRIGRRREQQRRGSAGAFVDQRRHDMYGRPTSGSGVISRRHVRGSESLRILASAARAVLSSTASESGSLPNEEHDDPFALSIVWSPAMRAELHAAIVAHMDLFDLAEGDAKSAKGAAVAATSITWFDRLSNNVCTAPPRFALVDRRSGSLQCLFPKLAYAAALGGDVWLPPISIRNGRDAALSSFNETEEFAMLNAEIDIGGVLGSRRGVVGNQGPTMAFNTNSAVRRFFSCVI